MESSRGVIHVIHIHFIAVRQYLPLLPLVLVLLRELLPAYRLLVQDAQALAQVSASVVSRVFEEQHVFQHLLRNRRRQERLESIGGHLDSRSGLSKDL